MDLRYAIRRLARYPRFNLSHLLRTMMTGVQRFDPQIYGVMTLVLFAAAALAAWLPLRAAYRIDPAVVLRSE